MTEAIQSEAAMRQARRRAMFVPREHGAWGLLLVPLFTGTVAGMGPEYRVGPLFAFLVAALALFALRTPVESLAGTGAISASTAGERRVALLAALCFAAPAAGTLVFLLWRGWYSGLLLLGAASALALVAQAVLRKMGRGTRMLSQLVGAISLTCTAPAAYYIGSGRLDTRAFVLWAANWLFAADQIHYVQLRIHAARAATPAEKLARGKWFLAGQVLLLAALLAAARLSYLPPLAILAFVPALARGAAWFFRGAEPLDVRRLGWSEMKQGVAFGVLLALVFAR